MFPRILALLALALTASATLTAQTAADRAARTAKKNAEFDADVKGVCSEHKDWTVAQCVDQIIHGHLDNDEGPQRYVLSHADVDDGGLIEFDCRRCSAMTDTLFVAAAHECGNAGCNFYVFRMDGSSYQYLTTVFLHALAFSFLQTKHHGLNDIDYYHHLSADSGMLVHYEFDGNNYQHDESKEVEVKRSDPQPSSAPSYTPPEPVSKLYFSKDLKRIR